MMAAMTEHMTSIDRQASNSSKLASEPDLGPSTSDVGSSAAATSVPAPSLPVAEEIAEKVHHL